jgi:phosphatidylinositol alpha-1,6-mannosyltransferase
MQPAGQVRVLLLFTDVSANGGIQRFNRTFLAALGLLGVRCDVISLQDSIRSIAGATPGTGARYRACAGNRLKFILQAARALLTTRYDWIVIGHINLLSVTMMLAMISPLPRPRRMMIAHGIEVWYGISRLRRSLLTRVDRTLCVSHYTRARLLQQIASPHAERFAVFPNAIGDFWASRERRPGNASLPKTFLLSVTRLHKGDRYKGIVTVLEALSMMADTALEYIIVGDGNDLEFLRTVAVRLQITSRVHFLRQVSDGELIELYERCEAFVLPSGKEGFGIVFLEAMYFGAPVIAAAEKGALDVVDDGVTGMLVPYGNCMAVKEAVERLRLEPALRERLRQGGRDMVTGGGVFTFSRFVERCRTHFELSGIGAS